MNSTIRYHLRELEIAKNPKDSNHAMPDFSEDDDLILDLGCGIGQTLVAAELGNGKFPVGIDIDFRSVLYGKKNYKNITFINGAGECLPFKDGIFDVVICRVSLPYSNINKSIVDIRRVLKDNGKIWLILHPFSMILKNLMMSVVRFQLKSTIFQIYVILNGAVLHCFGWQFPFPAGNRCESFQTGSGMKRVLRSNGFKNINITKERHFMVSATKSNVSFKSGFYKNVVTSRADREKLREALQCLCGDSNHPADASIIVPVNAQADLDTVYGLLSDIATYSGQWNFDIVLMVNNYPQDTEPEGMQRLRDLGIRVMSKPSVRKSDEEVFITARMVGLRAANTDYAVFFDADCRLASATELLDWYIEQFQAGVGVAYTSVAYYGLPEGSSIYTRMLVHRLARWIKRVVLRIPTTRGSNYGVNAGSTLRLYDEGKLNKDMKIGPVIKKDGGRVTYSDRKELLVLTSGRYIPAGWRSLFRYVVHRIRYHIHLNSALDGR